EYPSVDDNWLGVESSQGLSLLFADLSGSEVTDISLCHVKDCKNVEDLNLNFCDMISDVCVGCISGMNLEKITRKRPKPDKKEHEIVKSI
nr:F-box/LRR-repeat protein 14-like isoform X1 [Tanacetum cinerariifolium]